MSSALRLYNNNMGNYSRRFQELQKGLDEINRHTVKIDSKIKNIIDNFNETVITINNMFMNGSYSTEVSTSRSFSITSINENDITNMFGTSLDINQDFIVISDPFDDKGCVYVYHENQIQKIIPEDTDTSMFGEKITLYENNIVVLSKNNEKYEFSSYIYNNDEKKWKYIGKEEVELKSIKKIKLYDKFLLVLTEEKLEIYFCYIYEKTGEIEHKLNDFDIYQNKMVTIGDKLSIYILNTEGDLELVDKVNISGEQVKINNDEIFIMQQNKIIIYENKIKDEIKSLNSIRNISITNNQLFILTEKNEVHNLIDFDYNTFFHLNIYEKVNNKWHKIKNIQLNEFNHPISTNINSFDKKTILSFYTKEQVNYNGLEYLIENNNDKINWNYNVNVFIDKVDILITGDYKGKCTKFTIDFEKKIPKIKPNFYYKDKPPVKFDIYDIITDQYRNDIKVNNVIFTNERLEFDIDITNNEENHLVFYVNITYLTN